MLFPDAIFQPRFPFEKYLFYRDLGYSVKAARLLSELSYGDRALAFRIKRLGGAKPAGRARRQRQGKADAPGGDDAAQRTVIPLPKQNFFPPFQKTRPAVRRGVFYTFP